MLTYLKGFILFVVYCLGLKSEKENMDWQNTRAALKEANKAIGDQNGVRSKYAKLNNDFPNQWGPDGRVRASSGPVPKADKASVRAGSGGI